MKDFAHLAVSAGRFLQDLCHLPAELSIVLMFIHRVERISISLNYTNVTFSWFLLYSTTLPVFSQKQDWVYE